MTVPVPGQKLKCVHSYPLLYVRAGNTYTVAEVDESGHEVNVRFEETPESSWYSLCRFSNTALTLPTPCGIQ